MLAKKIGKGFGCPHPPRVRRAAIWSFAPHGRISRNWLLGLTAAFVCVGPLIVALLSPSEGWASVDFIAPFFAAIRLLDAV